MPPPPPNLVHACIVGTCRVQPLRGVLPAGCHHSLLDAPGATIWTYSDCHRHSKAGCVLCSDWLCVPARLACGNMAGRAGSCDAQLPEAKGAMQHANGRSWHTTELID